MTYSTMPSKILVSQRERQRDRNNRVQNHNRPQQNAPKRSGHTYPREKDRRPDVEDQETSHALARSCEIRGQPRAAQADQPNAGTTRPRGADPLRRGPDYEFGLGIERKDETGADDDLDPRRDLNGSSMPRCFSPLG